MFTVFTFCFSTCYTGVDIIGVGHVSQSTAELAVSLALGIETVRQANQWTTTHVEIERKVAETLGVSIKNIQQSPGMQGVITDMRALSFIGPEIDAAAFAAEQRRISTEAMDLVLPEIINFRADNVAFPAGVKLEPVNLPFGGETFTLSFDRGEQRARLEIEGNQTLQSYTAVRIAEANLTGLSRNRFAPKVIKKVKRRLFKKRHVSPLKFVIEQVKHGSLSSALFIASLKDPVALLTHEFEY